MAVKAANAMRSVRVKSYAAKTAMDIGGEAVFLNRQSPDSVVLGFNTNDPTQNLNANDFRLGVHTGFDLSATRRIADRYGLELRYFGFDHWNSNVVAATTLVICYRSTRRFQSLR